MKKTILAALAIVAMASCAKESSTTETIDPTAPVAATFTSASITRVADNAWEADNKIGITMVATADYTLATGSYENVPYTVGAAGESGTFSADDEVIYFPVNDTEVVDFIAYYPHSTADATTKNIEISVADQEYEHIDLVAAKAVGKSKSIPTVTFSDTEAFSHQLSKLTMNIVAGDGIDALTDIVATIKGQYTTATYNIYTSAVVADATADITALTTSVTAAVAAVADPATPATPAKATIEAILIPTSAIAGSTIEFAVGGNTYYLDTKDFVFTKGCEHTYTITLKRTGTTISGATISNWGSGEVVDNGELDASDYVEREETISATLMYEEEIYSIYVQLDMSNFDFFASRTLYIYQTSSPEVVYTETITDNSARSCSPTTLSLVMDSEYTIYLYTEYTDGTASTSNVVTVSTEASTATNG